MSRGRFIVVEGLDGAGSTTQVRLIADHLQRLGYSVQTTKEPSDGPFGTVLRRAIEHEAVFSPELLALGFATDRLSHMQEPGGTLDLLESGIWIVSDRYLPSALAYQAAQGVDIGWLKTINEFAPIPDATVFVDTPVKTCLSRITVRGENEDDIFHKRSTLYAVRKEYSKILSSGFRLGRLITADGSKPIPEIQNQIISDLHEVFENEFGLFSQFKIIG